MLLDYIRLHKRLVIIIATLFISVIGVSIYQATAKSITFYISEPGAILTLNGKVYELNSNAITLRLREQDYQVQVEKAGFETYDQVIHPTTSTTIRIPMRIKISSELTAALPDSVNQAGYNFKVTEPAYLENGGWAVAKVVQFESSDQDLDQLYAVFKKTPTGWKLVAGPLSELAPDDKTVKVLPEKVHTYLEKKL